ncbi:MAG: ATP-binding protein [Planctomycetota bacterium]
MSDEAVQDQDPDPSGRDEALRRERAETIRLRQLARLGAVFAGFAHEIRNPLSTIGLNLQLVQEDLGESEDPRESRIKRRLGVVESEVKRLNGILEEFLGFVRIPELRPVPTRPDTWLGDLASFLEPDAHQRKLSFRVFTMAGDQPLLVDEVQLRSVVVNLIRNAFQACEPGDQVLVRSVVEDDHWVMTVADTGPGMSADVCAKIFEPWFSTKPQGTGLGLPTARRIVEQHGGRLTVSSEPGRGTQFALELPVKHAEVA